MAAWRLVRTVTARTTVLAGHSSNYQPTVRAVVRRLIFRHFRL